MPTVNGATQTGYYQGVRTQEEKNQMGKEDFLKILVAQIQHQDPMQPMQDREFIAQMTQFSSLEQMINLNKTLTDFTKTQNLNTYAAAIGKEISWMDEETQTSEKGIVSGVTAKDGAFYYIVDNQKVPVEKAYQIRTPEA
ncbi:flagellar hook assembly protein FlgD [Ammoniphilus resinae]|uniref:Flagellar basal-body rod modification protein FlgD n=1 Tax=Ammoniphilus resinae TaxID=861532 RepID=A0ABS4GML1_9BACL|nr:flagellar basal-body rod modification protein FlgD [Ammoniphilus resinae]